MVRDLGNFLGAPAISATGGIMPRGAGAPLRSLPDYLPTEGNWCRVVFLI
jgi:hypothetical protein